MRGRIEKLLGLERLCEHSLLFGAIPMIILVAVAVTVGFFLMKLIAG
jgi:hypothetical protein